MIEHAARTGADHPILRICDGENKNAGPRPAFSIQIC